MATVVIIWVGGIVLIIMAVLSIIKGVFDVDATIMLIVAIICIIIDVAYAYLKNSMLFLILK